MLRIWNPGLLIVGLTTRSQGGITHRFVRLNERLKVPNDIILATAKDRNELKRFLGVTANTMYQIIEQPLMHFRVRSRLYVGITFDEMQSMRRNPFQTFHRLSGDGWDVPFDVLLTATPTERVMIEFCKNVQLIDDHSQMTTDAIDVRS